MPGLPAITRRDRATVDDERREDNENGEDVEQPATPQNTRERCLHGLLHRHHGDGCRG